MRTRSSAALTAALTAPLVRWLASVALLATLVVPRLAAAQEAPAGAGAAEIADSYLVALRAGEWRAAADLMAPEALDALKGLLRAAARRDDATGLMEAAFGGDEALQALPSAEVFVRFFRAIDAQLPELFAGIEDVRVLGVLPGREGQAHVLVEVRLLIGEQAITQDVALRVRHDGTRWSVLLPGDVIGWMQLAGRPY